MRALRMSYFASRCRYLCFVVLSLALNTFYGISFLLPRFAGLRRWCKRRDDGVSILRRYLTIYGLVVLDWTATSNKMDIQGIEPWTSRKYAYTCYYVTCEASALPLCQMPIYGFIATIQSDCYSQVRGYQVKWAIT